MELVTGKTGDVFVEMESNSDAIAAISRHSRRMADGLIDRLGDRPIDIELSSPDELLKTVFKNGSIGVKWNQGKPEIQNPPEHQAFGYFKGFVTQEELTMIIKHAEHQVRPAFSFLPPSWRTPP